MADHRERDEISGVHTTGHEWDGIKELDNPLPRWWLYVFYASILAAAIYWVLMPAWPTLNGYTPGILHYSDRNNVAGEIRALRNLREPMYRRLAQATPEQLRADPELQQFASASGQSVFGDYCATCHGAGGAGRAGYPVLADDVWLWGGSLSQIEQTIRVGIRSDHPNARVSMMPAFGRDHMLTPEQIGDAAEYVISISAARTRLHPNAREAARGAVVYQQQCASCHGQTGAGDRNFGVPSLLDDVWIYGGSRDEIRRQIELGRGGVMPSWEARFEPGVIRALAFYVHEMGGGEAEPPPPVPVVTPAAAVSAGDVAPAQGAAPDPAATR